MIPGLRVCAIIWYLFHAFQLVCVCTRAVMLDVTAADGSKIPMTTLSHIVIVCSVGEGRMPPCTGVI